MGNLYVTPAELAAVIGTKADDPRLAAWCAQASQVVDHYYGTATVAERLTAAPWPECVTGAAVTIAADLSRRPTAPGGYFDATDYTARLAQDPTSSVVALLNALPGGRVGWPIA